MTSHITTKEHAIMMQTLEDNLSAMTHSRDVLVLERDRLEAYLLEVKQAAGRCEEENERLRVIVEKRGLPIDVFHDCERLTAENLELKKCCSQRGERMQKLFHTLKCCMKRETISIQEWNEIVGWFDFDGMPVDKRPS